MQRQEISKEEVPMILKKFNRSLWLSLLVFPFVLFILLLPLYLLFFLVNLSLLKKHFDQEEIFTYYAVSILVLVFANFLYGKIITAKKIRHRKMYKVQEDFLVQKKDTYTYTSDTVSDSSYFRLYLRDENGGQKGIYVSKEDFRRIKENTPIQLTYYEKVNIAVTGWYENKKNRFLSLLIAIFSASCSPSVKDHYSGFIFYKNKPVTYAKITEQGTNNFIFTDHNGFFNLKRNDRTQINNLVIVHNDKAETDTIDLVRGGAAGQKKQYLFLTSGKDTIDLYRERIFRQQH